MQPTKQPADEGQSVGIEMRIAVRKSADSTADQYIIEGHASRPVLDAQKEFMPLEEVVKGFGSYIKRPIVTLEHGGRTIGHTIAHSVEETGVVAKALIFDVDAQRDIDAGLYPDFSVEGFANRRMEKHGEVVAKTLRNFEMSALAITKEGAVAGATHRRVAKSADGQEQNDPFEITVKELVAKSKDGAPKEETNEMPNEEAPKPEVKPESIPERLEAVFKAADVKEGADGPQNEEEKPADEKAKRGLPDPESTVGDMLKHHNAMKKGGNHEGAAWIDNAIAAFQTGLATLKANEPKEDAEAAMKSKAKAVDNGWSVLVDSLRKFAVSGHEQAKQAVAQIDGLTPVAKSVEYPGLDAFREEVAKSFEIVAKGIVKISNEPQSMPQGVIYLAGDRTVIGDPERVAKGLTGNMGTPKTADVAQTNNPKKAGLLAKERMGTITTLEKQELTRIEQYEFNHGR